MKTKKLLITALCGLLAFAPVLPVRAAESSGDSDTEETRVPEITQFDDADKTKFQALIDAMIEAVEADAFGKPAYTWTVPDLTDFVNKKFPNMTKTEEERDIVWKDGSTSKDKTITYLGENINTKGWIEHIDIYLSDGSLLESQDLAEYYVNVTDDYLRTIQASDHVSSNGSIYNSVIFADKQALTNLSSLNKALTMIDDPEVVSYMKTESKVDNSRQYNFPDGTKMTFTPNVNAGSSEDTRSEHQNSINAALSYIFRNHVINLHYNVDGTYSHIVYYTSFTPTDMFRLYNPNSGEHFYTASRTEADNLVTAGWNDEGLGWKAPAMSDTPVYRLYNPNSGDHHYTPDEEEKDNLIAAGWNDEGIGWYSFERQTTSLYRLYNPNAASGSHHYTTDKDERDYLVSTGWVDEGIGWYGM